MLVSRTSVILLLLIFIQDITEIVKGNPISDNEDYSGANSGSGQSALMNSNNCNVAYSNYSDCSFHSELIGLTSNGLINVTTNVMLLSVIQLQDLQNILIIGHNNPTVNCDNVGGIYFDHCRNCTITGITWEKCGNRSGSKPVMELYNSSNIIIQNCSFLSSATQSIALSEMSGNVTINGCTFTFNNYYEDHGVAIHYLSKLQQHSKFQFTISNCNFTHNGVASNQKIVYIGSTSNNHKEEIFLYNSVFINNQGIPIYILNQNVFVRGIILFEGNVANANEGTFVINHVNLIVDKANVKFINNKATYGGAFFITNNSNATFEGNSTVTINDNQADYGGALYINSNSNINFDGNSKLIINNNQAVYSGAIYVYSDSNLTFEGNSTITINNSEAYWGGAIYIRQNSEVTFQGNSKVAVHNSYAVYWGGAFYIRDNSKVTFQGNTLVTVHNNSATYKGGALYITSNCDAKFMGNSMVIINNNQAEKGGAFYIFGHSDTTFKENSIITINNNQARNERGALSEGGAFYIEYNSGVTSQGNSTVMIANNLATENGGALLLSFICDIIFEGNSTVIINENEAKYGGALYLRYLSNVIFEGNATVKINSNEAYDGGALYIVADSGVTYNGTSKVSINNNEASNGGALYVSEYSDVTFEGNSTVTISNNNVTFYGGVLYIKILSNVTFQGNSIVTINNNQADHGGALYIEDSPKVTIKENSTVTINNNQANEGGAFYIDGNRNVTFEGDSTVTINNNQASDGGALYIKEWSCLIFDGNCVVTFDNNTVSADGGALYVHDNCNVKIKGNSLAIFNNNQASGDGGALCSSKYNDITFQENSKVKFNDNRAAYFGGALCSKDHSNINFENNSTILFNNNQASQGGAIFSPSNTNFTQNSKVQFDSNKAILGGALQISNLVFEGNSEVALTNNEALLQGGALYSTESSITMKQESTINFINNKAKNGGAIYISATTLLVSEYSNVTFDKNIAGEDGGAIYINDQLNIIFENSSTVTLTSNIADTYGGAIYSKITQNTKHLNISEINYYDNSARVSGNLLYIDVPKSCNASCLTDSTAGINNDILRHNLSDKTVATSPNILKLYYPAKCITNDSVGCDKYYIDNIMLGQEITIPACFLDYYNRPAEATQFKIIGEDHHNYFIQGLHYSSISCNHSIEAISIIGNNTISDSSHLPLNYSISFISHTSFKSARKTITVNLTVELSPCHPGFVYHSKSQKCECYNNSEIVYCSGSSSTIKRGYWLGYVDGISTVTFCPISYCNFTLDKTTNGYYHLSPERVNQCASYRSGIACGSCEEDHTLSFDSAECISNDKCTTGQMILVTTLSVFYWFVVVVAVFVIMYYQVGIGYFYAITYYYSIVDILLIQHTDISNGLYFTVTIMSSIAKVTPQFLGQLCLFKNMSGIDQQFIHYVHPLAVLVILIIITWLTRHFERMSAFISRRIVHAICFLLLLSYTSVATTSMLLMRSLTFADVDNVYAYLSPDIKYFHGRHLFYGIIAIILLLLIVIGLPLLLLLEPFLNAKVNFIRIKPLLDQFQGCFKDKCRWFAAFYMICRLIIITIIIANLSETFISRYLLITATTIIALIHQIVRPYANNILNMFDGAILQLMVLVTALPLFQYFDAYDSSLVIAVAFVFVVLPLVQFIALNVFIYRGTIKEITKGIIKRFSSQDKPCKDEPNKVIANSSATNDFNSIIDDYSRRSTSITICKMYVSTYIMLLPIKL